MQPNNYWQGTKVRLRAVEPEDADVFFAWNLDSETARMMDFVWPPQSLASNKEWAAKKAVERATGDEYMLVIEDPDGEVVGLINTHGIDRRVGAFRYGFSVRSPHRRRGYASEAVLIVLRYFFEELGYQKCTVTVYANNEASQTLHEKLGFQLEGRLRRMIRTQGQFFDELHYGMTAEEFAAAYGHSSAG